MATGCNRSAFQARQNRRDLAEQGVRLRSHRRAEAARPYDTFKWAEVSHIFLVHAINLAKSNVASWLGRK
ncbi:MAG: hypothetical protein ACREDV_09940 [Methylocella sp.]